MEMGGMPAAYGGMPAQYQQQMAPQMAYAEAAPAYSYAQAPPVAYEQPQFAQQQMYAQAPQVAYEQQFAQPMYTQAPQVAYEQQFAQPLAAQVFYEQFAQPQYAQAAAYDPYAGQMAGGNMFPQTASFVASPQYGGLPTSASMIAYPGASAMDGPFKFYAAGEQPANMGGQAMQNMQGAPAPQGQAQAQPGAAPPVVAPTPARRPAKKKAKKGCC